MRAGYDYAHHFVQPAHFLSRAWGYAPGPPGTEGGMSFQLGAVPLILASWRPWRAFRRPAGGAGPDPVSSPPPRSCSSFS